MSFYTVISRNNCQYCTMVLEDLYEAGERPIVHHVDKDPSIRTLMLMAGLKTVPQVFAPDGYHIGGYAETVQWLIDKEMDDTNDPY